MAGQKISFAEMETLANSVSLDQFREKYLVRHKDYIAQNPLTFARRVTNIWYRRDELLKTYAEEYARRNPKTDHTVMVPAHIKPRNTVRTDNDGRVMSPIPPRGDSLPDVGDMVHKCLDTQREILIVLKEQNNIMLQQLHLFEALAKKTTGQ